MGSEMCIRDRMNSVVSKDVPANCMAIGNPCIVVRQFDADMINKIEEYYK